MVVAEDGASAFSQMCSFSFKVRVRPDPAVRLSSTVLEEKVPRARIEDRDRFRKRDLTREIFYLLVTFFAIAKFC